jgi:tyrosyl-tRNA synthetase
MMWRYYELLTDVQVMQIETMKLGMHPMQAKKGLATLLVTDFHSADTAKQAAEDWARQFQKREVPESLETIEVKMEDVQTGVMEEAWEKGLHVKLDKLLARAGLAESVSDAARKLRQRAVQLNGEVKTDPVVFVDPAKEIMLRVGKRMRRVRIVIPGNRTT